MLLLVSGLPSIRNLRQKLPRLFNLLFRPHMKACPTHLNNTRGRQLLGLDISTQRRRINTEQLSSFVIGELTQSAILLLIDLTLVKLNSCSPEMDGSCCSRETSGRQSLCEPAGSIDAPCINGAGIRFRVQGLVSHFDDESPTQGSNAL